MRHVEEIKYEIARLDKMLADIKTEGWEPKSLEKMTDRANGRKWALLWVLEEEK